MPDYMQWKRYKVQLWISLKICSISETQNMWQLTVYCHLTPPDMMPLLI